MVPRCLGVGGCKCKPKRKIFCPAIAANTVLSIPVSLHARYIDGIRLQAAACRQQLAGSIPQAAAGNSLQAAACRQQPAGLKNHAFESGTVKSHGQSQQKMNPRLRFILSCLWDFTVPGLGIHFLLALPMGFYRSRIDYILLLVNTGTEESQKRAAGPWRAHNCR